MLAEPPVTCELNEELAFAELMVSDLDCDSRDPTTGSQDYPLPSSSSSRSSNKDSVSVFWCQAQEQVDNLVIGYQFAMSCADFAFLAHFLESEGQDDGQQMRLENQRRDRLKDHHEWQETLARCMLTRDASFLACSRSLRQRLLTDLSARMQVDFEERITCTTAFTDEEDDELEVSASVTSYPIWIEEADY